MTVRNDTLNADYDALETLISQLRQHSGEDSYISAGRMVIETQNTKLEITADGDQLELREIA